MKLYECDTKLSSFVIINILVISFNFIKGTYMFISLLITMIFVE